MNLSEVNNYDRSIAQTADRVLNVSDVVLTDWGRCRK